MSDLPQPLGDTMTRMIFRRASAAEIVASTARFSRFSAAYARHRPGYPAAAVAHVLAGTRPEACLVADIGAGTGILSRLLAERLGPSSRLIAVEPNDQMRSEAAPHPKVEWRAAVAEATGLDSASVDLITCAQAFHWFDPLPSLAEFHRILKPGGRLAILTNQRAKGAEFTLRYNQILDGLMGKHPVEARGNNRRFIRKSRLFCGHEQAEFDNQRRLGADELVGLALSSSRCNLDDKSQRTLETQLRQLHDDLAGPDQAIRLPWVTSVFTCRRA